MDRDQYNQEILDEALAFQDANYSAEYSDQEFDGSEYDDYMVDNDEGFEEGDSSRDLGRDPELDAQIDLVETLIRDGAPHATIDAAVDHLRGMLTIGYCDEDELPAVTRRVLQPATSPLVEATWAALLAGVVLVGALLAALVALLIARNLP